MYSNSSLTSIFRNPKPVTPETSEILTDNEKAEKEGEEGLGEFMLNLINLDNKDMPNMIVRAIDMVIELINIKIKQGDNTLDALQIANLTTASLLLKQNISTTSMIIEIVRILDLVIENIKKNGDNNTLDGTQMSNLTTATILLNQISNPTSSKRVSNILSNTGLKLSGGKKVKRKTKTKSKSKTKKMRKHKM
jgi:hypothetical protein